MKIQVCVTHIKDQITHIDLPDGMTVDDIDRVYVKWGKGEIHFKDRSMMSFDEVLPLDYDYKKGDLIEYRKDYDSEWIPSEFQWFFGPKNTKDLSRIISERCG